MRAHATAIVLAAIMALPTGAAVAAACDGDMLIKGACCCDDSEPDGSAPSIDGACCCELQQPMGQLEAQPAMAPAAHDDHAPAMVALVWSPVVDRPAPSATATAVRSRGPPPTTTLVSQRILLLC